MIDFSCRFDPFHSSISDLFVFLFVAVKMGLDFLCLTRDLTDIFSYGSEYHTRHSARLIPILISLFYIFHAKRQRGVDRKSKIAEAVLIE